MVPVIPEFPIPGLIAPFFIAGIGFQTGMKARLDLNLSAGARHWLVVSQHGTALHGTAQHGMA